MTWRPPYGKAELVCDHQDGEGRRCPARMTVMSNGSWQYDRRVVAEQGWTYRPIVGDLCPEHS